MAGKRLLDAAKLVNAGTSVAKQHLAQRRQQWDVYSQTSSLVNAVKSQTDRVTGTAGAAYELAKRFSETTPAWQQGQEQTQHAGTREAAAERSDVRASAYTADAIGSKGSGRGDSVSRGFTIDQSPDNGSPASLRKREAQRQAEAQIPETATGIHPSVEGATGQDTFNERGQSSSPEFSSLPRMKIPKSPGQTQGSNENLSDDNINQDVYYAPVDEGHAPKKSSSPDDLPAEGVNTDVYSSPRVSRMLGSTKTNIESPYSGRSRSPSAPLAEMVTVQERREREAQQSTVNTPESVITENARGAGEEETQRLAAGIAQEAEHRSLDSIDHAAEPAGSTFEMRESRVPSSRFGRLWQYGGLATSMAFGAVGESFRRITGANSEGSLMLSDGNMNRLVAKLSRMRGAALKLGQMISFQDSKVLPPTINAVLQRVQDSADYMPPSQCNQVMVQNLGQDWEKIFSTFEKKPFAAASIGQVHKATLASNGKAVAVKVQYPGVRNSIDSDLNNLSLLLTASRLLPKGLYLEKTIDNARTELGWECDYEREAEACIRFKGLISDETDAFTVPTVYLEASGPGVLTAEFLTGTAVAKINDLTQDERDWIGTQILRLSLRELMEWRFMQTDPNWTNFLYNRETEKLELLDFGASREYPDKFVEPYVSLLIAASKGDRESCRELSIRLGYLTGHESEEMVKAHVDSVLTLAEPFVESAAEVYDFEDQTITERVRANIGLMLRERLAPPPEETYSLHRKLSGAFLLCARLQSRVRARDMFASAVEVWHGRSNKINQPL